MRWSELNASHCIWIRSISTAFYPDLVVSSRLLTIINYQLSHIMMIYHDIFTAYFCLICLVVEFLCFVYIIFYSLFFLECPTAKDGQPEFYCPTPDKMGNWRCIDDFQLCDGVRHCPNGEDELPVSCLFYRVVSFICSLSF